MKKGNTVTFENGLTFYLVDSVSYSGEKYFAATSDDDSDETIYFFKYINDEDGESLELIDRDDNEKVIDALIEHMRNTF